MGQVVAISRNDRSKSQVEADLAIKLNRKAELERRIRDGKDAEAELIFLVEEINEDMKEYLNL